MHECDAHTTQRAPGALTRRKDLTKAVPLGDSDKPFHNVSPALVALLTTLSCLFLTFALITRAFLLLAMLEYFPQGTEARRSPDDG